MTAVIQEAYIQGVSTRSVDDLVKTMGMTGVSKSQVSDVNACGTDFRFSIRRISGSSQPSRSEDEQEIRNQQSLG